MLPTLRHIPKIEARAAAASLAVGLGLMGLKFVAYFLTGSAAIFSDALESIVNVLAATFALYSLAVAHAPADEEHPYGHGKIEFLSAAFEGGMILLASVVIAIQAISTVFQRHAIQERNLDWGLGIIAVALVGNGAAGLYLVLLGRRRKSLLLEADGRHLLSDAITSVVVLVALALVRLSGWHWIDPAAALVVSLYVAWMGGRLVRQASAGLMDEQDPKDEILLRGILDAHASPDGRPPRICSYHKLRHRHSGRYHWVDFHLVVPKNWTIEQGHHVASAIEYEIELALKEGNATAHVEPCAETTCTYCAEGGAELRRD
jgi:cation diffusion facilitator family transporter